MSSELQTALHIKNIPRVYNLRDKLIIFFSFPLNLTRNRDNFNSKITSMKTDLQKKIIEKF